MIFKDTWTIDKVVKDSNTNNDTLYITSNINNLEIGDWLYSGKYYQVVNANKKSYYVRNSPETA
jgi:hypothetical protein